MDIIQINNSLSKIVATLFPDLQIVSKNYGFMPTLQLNLADALSPIPIEIGKLTKTPPHEIALEIADTLGCLVVGDHLALNFDDGTVPWLKRTSIYSDLMSKTTNQIVIILPQLTPEVPKNEYFRLFGTALCQLMLLRALNIQSEIYLLNEALLSKSEELSLKKCYKKLFLPPAKVNTKNSLEEIFKSIKHETCLWLAPSVMVKTDFNFLYNNFIRDNQNIKLQCLNRSWLQDCVGYDDFLTEFATWSEKDLAALSFYLANPKQADEIHVAQFAESDNILWLLKSTRERLAKCQFKRIENLSSLQISKIKHAYFLDYYLKKAAFRGDVLAYIKVLNGFLKEVLSFLDSQDLRFRMSQGHLSIQEQECLTALEIVLNEHASMLVSFF